MTKYFKALILAAMLGNFGMVLSMTLSAEEKAKYSNYQSRTTHLMMAAQRGSVSGVNKYLHLAGARNTSGQTALMWQFMPCIGRNIPFNAVTDKKIAEMLLEKKEDPNLSDEQGMTALMYALDKLRKDISTANNILKIDIEQALPLIELLLNAMSKEALNKQNMLGETALYIASRIREGEKIVQLLLDKGADHLIVPVKEGQDPKEACVRAYLGCWGTPQNEKSADIMFEHFKSSDADFVKNIQVLIR